MRILTYIFSVIVAIVIVECNLIHDSVNLCYQKTKVENVWEVCQVNRTKCTLDDRNEWVFLNSTTRKLQDLSWENRQFTCFHACMMTERGEMERDKINLEKYIANFAVDYNFVIDEHAKLQINECALKANRYDDKCYVAATMGECITEKWNLIEQGLRKK